MAIGEAPCGFATSGRCILTADFPGAPAASGRRAPHRRALRKTSTDGLGVNVGCFGKTLSKIVAHRPGGFTGFATNVPTCFYRF